MKPHRWALLFLMAGSSVAWGEDNKAALEQSRADYQRTVAAHGPNSPEALTRRENLRLARKNFHAEHRQQIREIRLQRQNFRKRR